jgi:carbonic anhydrase/acetyltransferase-like protein (isoleucine patch superfamily)
MSGLILPWEGVSPDIHSSAFIAPTATVIGDTVIGEEASIWYGCTVRGDVNHIRIGNRTNLQDNSVIHVDAAAWPTIIGDDVLIGHMCLIHGCTIGDGAFIGMRACIMDGAVIEPEGMVAAGALVTPGKVVPTGQIWAGNPAKYMRDIDDAQLDWMRKAAPRYAGYAARHKANVEAAGS